MTKSAFLLNLLEETEPTKRDRLRLSPVIHDTFVGYCVSILNKYKKSIPKQYFELLRNRSLFNRDDMTQLLNGVTWAMLSQKTHTKYYKNLEQYMPDSWDKVLFLPWWEDSYDEHEDIYREAITKFHKQLKDEMHKREALMTKAQQFLEMVVPLHIEVAGWDYEASSGSWENKGLI